MKRMKEKATEKNGFVYSIESFLDRHKVSAWFLLAIILLTIPFMGFSSYLMRILIMIGVYAMLGMGLNILTGYTGLVSLGHAGFFAIGAYTASVLMLRLDVPFICAMLIAACVTGLIGLLVGLPSLRLTGSYLTIVTLGFGEIVKMIIVNWDSMTNGTLGLKNIPKPSFFGIEMTLSNHGLYYTMLVLVLVIAAACITIIRSDTGRTFQAIKEDELAATMMGIRTFRYKLLSFVISAFITGVAGAFYATLVGFIDANSFTFDVSVLIISVVIVGGMGTMRGMFLGAALLIAFPEVSRDLMEYRFVVYGLLLVLMMRYRPQGLLGWKSQMPYKLSKRVKAALADQKSMPVRTES